MRQASNKKFNNARPSLGRANAPRLTWRHAAIQAGELN